MYVPWPIAATFAIVIVVSRLITNKKRTTTGHIPTWVSLLYMLGFVGMLSTFIWSIVTIGWWGPIPIILLYFITGLVPSAAVEAYRRRQS